MSKPVMVLMFISTAVFILVALLQLWEMWTNRDKDE